MHVIAHSSWLSVPFLCFRLSACHSSLLLLMHFSVRKALTRLEGLEGNLQRSNYAMFADYPRLDSGGTPLMCGTPSQEVRWRQGRSTERRKGKWSGWKDGQRSRSCRKVKWREGWELRQRVKFLDLVLKSGYDHDGQTTRLRVDHKVGGVFTPPSIGV